LGFHSLTAEKVRVLTQQNPTGVLDRLAASQFAGSNVKMRTIELRPVVVWSSQE
jgi:hypothetical protein